MMWRIFVFLAVLSSFINVFVVISEGDADWMTLSVSIMYIVGVVALFYDDILEI